MSQFDFLTGHGFTFDNAGAACFFGDVGEDSPGVITGSGEMDMAAVFLDGGLKLFEIIIQVVERVLLDVAASDRRPSASGNSSMRCCRPSYCRWVLELTAFLRRSSPAAFTLMEWKSNLASPASRKKAVVFGSAG
jgi:hypothetical protein